MAPPPSLIFVAQVGAAIGLKGQFRLISHMSDPLAVADFGPLFNSEGQPTLHINTVAPHKGSLIATAKGVSDRTQADRIKGLKLYLRRDQLPPADDEDEVYIADLIGLFAHTPEGVEIGRIIGVDNFGAGDLLNLRPQKGADFYVPFTKAAVPIVEVITPKIVIETQYLPSHPETDHTPEDDSDTKASKAAPTGGK